MCNSLYCGISDYFWGNWKQGSEFYPYSLNLMQVYEGDKLFLDSTSLITSQRNWLKNSQEITFHNLKESSSYSFDLKTDNIVYSNKDTIFYLANYGLGLYKTTLDISDKRYEQRLLNFNTIPEINHFPEYVVFKSGDLAYTLDKNNSTIDSFPFLSSQSIVFYNDSLVISLLQTSEGSILTIVNDENTKVNHKIDLTNNVSAKFANQSIYLFQEKKKISNGLSNILYRIKGSTIEKFQYTSPIQDIIALGDSIFVLSENKLQDLNNSVFYSFPEILIDYISHCQLTIDGKRAAIFVFRNGALGLFEDGKVFLYDELNLNYIPSGGTGDIIFDLNSIIIDADSLSIIGLQENSDYILNRVLDKILLIFLIILGLSLSYYFYRKYQRASREIKELTTDTKEGILFTIDQKNRVRRYNRHAKELLKIERPNTLISDTYTSGNEELLGFIEIIKNNRRDISKKIHLVLNGSHKEFMFQANIISGSFGGYRGAIFVGTDITEELERKRLRNWAQLAHDMQTNLSVINLNAEQLQILASGADLQRIEKIRHQTGILLQRVRDIVTIGRSGEIQMEDASIKKIFEDLRLEFESANSDENISFNFETHDFKAYIDAKKVTRALRNAIENSINAIKQAERIEGLITVKAVKELRYFYLIIEDNGKGMEAQVRDRMLQPYFTTGAASGGSGIGTMIMSNVLEIHGGSIDIQSKPGEGTTITFKLPLNSKT